MIASSQRFRSIALFLAAAMLATASGSAAAATIPSPMNLPRAPLFLNSSVDPNVAITLDDSGSMTSAFIPDAATGSCGIRHPRFYSSVYNRIYYNPAVRYAPPLGPTGTPFPDSLFTAAPYDGFEASGSIKTGKAGSATINLSTQFWPTQTMNANSNSAGTRIGHDPRLRPAAPTPGSSNGGTTDAWYTNCTNPGAPTPNTPAISASNAWLPFASTHNSSATPFFAGIGTGANTSAAFYYRFTGNPLAAADINNPRLYDPVDMRNESTAQKTNFANWFSYYRTRNMMARSALTRVFGVQDSGMRVTIQNLNSNGFSTGTQFNKFQGAARAGLFQSIYAAPASGNTPNRAAMIRAGERFRAGAPADSAATNPYWEGAPANRELSCRQNFHVHMTDGYTNESGNPSFPLGSVSPRTGMTLPDGRSFSTSAPESRIIWNVLNPASPGCSGTGGACDPSLARVAFGYWATDLRTNLANQVPPFFGDRTVGVTNTTPRPVPANPADDAEIYWNPENDPANWQHMVNYTVGLGVSGLRNYPSDLLPLRTNSAVAWPGLRNNLPEGIDDLWHAGLASRGGYYSAGDPQELVDALSAALTSVISRRGTATAASVTSGIIQTSTLVFRTGFDSGDWSGQVFAYRIGDDGRVIDPPQWEAGALLNLRAPDDRIIFTSEDHDGGGINFEWGELPSDYQDELNDNPATLLIDDDGLGERRVGYIRGDRSQELANGGSFRNRTGLLGAVISSSAAVVAAPSAVYADDDFPGGPEQSASAQKYSEFRATWQDRPRTVYVGANDGMMHAFDAGSGITGFETDGTPIVDYGTGREKWAYIPREVGATLSRMTNPVFEFTPYVDATPAVRDVFINGQWRTLLVGALRRGGQGVYALDVTNPEVTAGDAANVVLWEYSDDLSNAQRMGFTFGRPNISRLANGRWVVLVPGGYNSEQSTPSEPQVAPADTSAPVGGSSLFVLDAADGSLIRRFDFAPAVSRGLSAPTMGDYQLDFIDEFAVAGDLQGNLWRFDLSNPNPGSWSVVRMFRPAVDFDQPITSAPRLFADPVTDSLIAVFGTGKYLEPGDRGLTGVPTQSFYGVRDYGPSSANYPIQASQLQLQTLTKTTGTPSTFTVTNNTVAATSRGWRINLLDLGERSVTAAGAVFSQGMAIFSTIIPNGDDPCAPALRGNLYFLGGANGAAPSVDRNGDGIVNAADASSPIGTSVPQAFSEGTPSTMIPPGGGLGTLVDYEQSVPTTVWRRRSWREITPEE